MTMKNKMTTGLIFGVCALGLALACPGADRPRLSVFHNHIADMAKDRGISIAEAVKVAQSWGIEGVDVFDAFDKGESAEILNAGMLPSTFVLSVDFAHSADSNKVEKALAFVRDRKCPRIMLVPGYLNPGEDRDSAWQTTLPRIRSLVRRAGELGVKVELEDFDDRNAVVGSAEHLRRAFAAVPELGHVFDTGNYDLWGDDARAVMREFRPRIGHVHVKDLSRDGTPRSVAAGTGRLPIRELVSELAKGGYRGWLTIECFGSPDIGRDVETAAAFLRGVLAEAASAPGRIALQLYSIRSYIERVGLAKALADVAAIGYEGVEFAGYYGHGPAELKALLATNGLVCCGTQVDSGVFSPENAAATCRETLAFGCDFICCTGGGNFPPGCDWGTESIEPSPEIDAFTRRLCDYYNRAAADCAKHGCKIGIHNHMWEFLVKLTDGTSFWDYFLSHTDPSVQFELDVGWATCAGLDPVAEFRKYPHRSVAMHAKENGMGRDVKEFEGILGRPGRPGAKPVDWDRVLPAAVDNGVEWFIVECERGEDGLDVARSSFEFLKAKMDNLKK